MPSTSLYPVVAGASLVLALWQPADADTRLRDATTQMAPVPATQSDRASRKVDDQVARHKQRWEQRKSLRRQASGAGS